MCGIIGCVSNRPVAPILMDGLKRMEYRGYDSAGIVILEGQTSRRETQWVFRSKKAVGKLKNLNALLQGQNLSGQTGIGHTRWATHGAPATCNAHPFFSCDNEIAVVHNGIIENYQELRKELLQRKHVFQSETDSEVVVHLVEEYLGRHQPSPLRRGGKGRVSLEPIEAVRLVCNRLRGSFALVFMFTRFPNLIIGARLYSPLVLGLGKQETFLASDVPAFLKHTRRVVYLQDKRIVEIKGGNNSICHSHESGNPEKFKSWIPRTGNDKSGRNDTFASLSVNKQKAPSVKVIDFSGKAQGYHAAQVNWNIKSAEKEGYAHFMLKEIDEQPEVVKRTVNYPHYSILEPIKKRLSKINRVVLVACGTAWHASIAAKYAIEELAKLPTEAFIGSEFRYALPPLDKHTLVVAVSQSGETADTLAAVRAAKEHGALCLAVCNVVGSSLTREAHSTLYTFAGPEISVASTKAYTCQLALLTILAVYLARARKAISPGRERELIKEIKTLPDKIRQVLAHKKTIEKCAETYKKVFNYMYIGRKNNLATAYEGALKMKEISYTHAEGYGAGEMKHGPLALVDGSFPTIAIALKDSVYEKMISNIREIKARQGIVIVVVTEGDKHIREIAESVIELPPVAEIVSPILAVIPLQLLAYYTAVKKGRDIDQPRNLAKSVTVE